MSGNCNFPNQIDNRNFLSPIGFKFSLSKEPTVAFFANAAQIPNLNLKVETQSTYLKNIPVPGDVMEFGDFTLKFIVDEDMENYMAVHNWLYGLGFPESTKQYKDLITDKDGVQDIKYERSDGTLFILNSNYKTSAKVRFTDMFPYSLSSLEFDATNSDLTYFTATVSFKYTIYDIEV